jgi:Na+-driven multidrug efflux pump
MYICCLMGVGDGMHIVWRFAVQGAGDTRWPLVVLTLAAFLGMGLPAMLITRVLPPEMIGRLGLTPLTVCWLVFGIYLVAIAAIMRWRYRYGPWRQMSLRL